MINGLSDIFAVAVFSTFLVAVGIHFGERDIRNEAIKRGVAYRDENGKFHWKDEK